VVPAATKIALIDRLSATGLSSIEATSFVSPKWVPQLADAAEVYAGIARRKGVSYPVLVPNEQGYERARAVGVAEIAVFTAASEAFSRSNINASIDESIARFEPVLNARQPMACACAATSPPCSAARTRAMCHCPMWYAWQRACTRWAATKSRSATPSAPARRPAARAMLRAVADEVPMAALAVHFHDTRGQALANVLACLEEGVRVVDAAVAGTGGCPMPRAPAAMSPAKTWSTCCMDSASIPASTSPR
jgi:hydroxymethylglutaryl-CoA lyase